MRALTLPRHLPLVDTLGLALIVFAFTVPEARNRWLTHVVEVLYFYSAFWGLVDLHQRGLLTKSVRQLQHAVGQSPRRTRFEFAAFMATGAVFMTRIL